METLPSPDREISVLVVGPAPHGSVSIERYAADLTASLNDLDSVHATRALPPSLPVQSQHRGAARVWQRGWAAIRRVRRYAQSIARVWLSRPRVLSANADIYHATSKDDAYQLSGLPRERTIVTCHDLFNFSREHRALRSGLRRWMSPGQALGQQLFRKTLAEAGHVVCASEQTRDEVLEHIPIDPQRVSVIPNGLAPHFRLLDPDVVQNLRATLPDADHLIIQVPSAGHPRKNVPGTLRALRTLLDRSLDVRLLNVGKALEGATGQLATELGIRDRIVECGSVDEERLVGFYNVADVLLFPSFYEGFGWPPLEAMACGTPAVVSTAPVFAEVLGDDALSADPDDSDALATQVESLLTDAELAAEFRHRGLERAARYRWDHAAARFESIYRRMLAADAAAARP